jgi:acetylornithine/N-succinyldiaminopimelate aminotransferase
MEKQQIKALDQQHVLGCYARFDFYPESGSGAVCTDCEGKTYVDFSSGIGVNSQGFCDPDWVSAVCNQAGKLAHLSNLYYTQPCILLAQKLCLKTGMSKVFFANSGAEANEGAIKAARKYSFDHYGEGRNEIVSLLNSFHGRTMTALTATGQLEYHKYFHPFAEGFCYAEPNNWDDLLAKITPKTCAVMMELVQGEGGVVPLDGDYVQAVAAYCKEHDLMLIIDEVQTGVGRTGKLFAYEHFGILPDLLTCAKGLGGGLPIGAVLFGERCDTSLGHGDHGSTFGGNPIACAGAGAVLDKMTDNFLDQVTQKGAYLKGKLLKLEGVESVSGLGLMLGITLQDKNAKEVVAGCLEKGLIALTAKSKVRLLPPLTITYEEIDKGLEILGAVLAEKPSAQAPAVK